MHIKLKKKNHNKKPIVSKKLKAADGQSLLPLINDINFDFNQLSKEEVRSLIFAIASSPHRTKTLASLLSKKSPEYTFTTQCYGKNEAVFIGTDLGDFPVILFTPSTSKASFSYLLENIDESLTNAISIKDDIHQLFSRINECNAELATNNASLDPFFSLSTIVSYLMSSTKKLSYRVDSLNGKLDFQFKALADNAQYHAHLNKTCNGNWITHQYRKARTLKRHFIIYSGPTNSGKTYNGLKHFTRENTGVYLAPLRLLALEIKELIDDDIAPCDLLTGEETILSANACHVSSTIEMLNPHKLYDVAFIDEGQMLRDAHRGSSWTRAILGVAAKKVIVATSPDAINTIIKLIELTNDTFEVHNLERKTTLNLIDKQVKANDLLEEEYKQTAIIAFSRKDVLNIAGYYRHKGIPTSAIYGAMPPEARRTQAELFKSGETTLLVATDAIAMGLNLPIKNVIFAKTEKYNGEETVDLDTALVKQIAGRAGRYGIFDNGFVGCMLNSNGSLVKDAINSAFNDTAFKVRIRPEQSLLLSIAKKMDTEVLNDILSGFFAFTSNTDLLLPDNLDEPRAIAEKHALILEQFELEYALALCFAPISVEREEDNTSYINALNYIIRNRSMDFRTFIGKHASYDVIQATLRDAENISRSGGLYHFFHKRFPDIFTDMETVRSMRVTCSQIISNHLSELSSPTCSSCSEDLPLLYKHRQCNDCYGNN